MFKQDLLYNHSSVLIAAVLFTLIILASEAGYRYARRSVAKSDDGLKSQTNAIQAGMLGLLALLLGFSFTMAVQRFDNRSAAVVEESNAIGTAYLRADLLPAEHTRQAKALLAEYVDLRVAGASVELTDVGRREADGAATVSLQGRLWQVALAAIEADPRPVTSGLYLQSLNDLIDAYSSRQAALEKHIPEIVLFLLFAIFIISGCILGYVSGLGGQRPWLATVALTGLIVLVIFLVIDLDRPRRGLIAVQQTSMTDLQSQVAVDRTGP